MLYGLEIES